MPRLMVRVARRLVAIPILVVAAGAIAVASPVLLAVAALVSLPDPRRRVLRLTWLAVDYLARDLATTVTALGASTRENDARDYRRLARFLDGLLSSTERTLSFRLVVESESRDAERALHARERPLIVVSRHFGVGDSFLLIQQLLSVYDRVPRVVMKAALQFDPVIDLLGNRLPNCFISHSDDATASIEHLAGTLGPQDALVIFPEGANFTPQRRRRALASLARRRQRTAARRAMRLHSVLPPRTRGVNAALDAAPGADVVIVAHHGLPSSESPGRFWREIPLRAPVRMRLWLVPRGQVPDGEQAREDWLYGRWQQVDSWVAAAAR